MTLSIRRLGPGDQAILALLAEDEPDFDLEGRAGPLAPLDAAVALSYLENPAVLHWVADEDGEVVAHLLCHVLPLRSGEGRELLLYEIGVRSSHRRLGIGRALLDGMVTWMETNGVGLVWVVADNQAAAEFYQACGFAASEPGAVYMQRSPDASTPECEGSSASGHP